jgi:hypothetical protein
MGSITQIKSGCSFRAAGQQVIKQPTTPGSREREMGYCLTGDVRITLGNSRVFPPFMCPDALRPPNNGLGETRIPIKTDYVEKMKSQSHRHLHLFCVPRLSVAKIVETMPEKFLDLSGLTPKVMEVSASPRERDWRWFLVSRLANNTSPSGNLTLADSLYVNMLFHRATGENFFGARTACQTGLGSNSLIQHDEEGRISIPKWSGLGCRVFYAYGFVITK